LTTAAEVEEDLEHGPKDQKAGRRLFSIASGKAQILSGSACPPEQRRRHQTDAGGPAAYAIEIADGGEFRARDREEEAMKEQWAESSRQKTASSKIRSVRCLLPIACCFCFLPAVSDPGATGAETKLAALRGWRPNAVSSEWFAESPARGGH